MSSEYILRQIDIRTIYISKCGYIREPNGVLFRVCGFKADRHVVAAINIAKKFGYTYKQLQM